MITSWEQGRSQNLKDVAQHFTEVLNVDDVTVNDVIRRNEHRKENKMSSIVITDIKLALYLKKDLEFCFSFLWLEHLHTLTSWVHGYACILASLHYFVHGALSTNIYLFKV